MIEHIKSRFRTRDGKEHTTWNAARKHQTGLELADALRAEGCDLSDEELIRVASALLEGWYVSRRKRKGKQDDDAT